MKSVFNDYRQLFGLTLVLSFLMTLPAFAQKHRMNKDISEQYSVGQNDELEISNKYGNVTINTWNQREISVNVKIEAWGKNEEQVKEMLDRINIKHGKSGNTISFHTEIDSKSWSVNNNDKKGFEINYTVNMPDNNPMTLSNKYGRISMPDYKGDLKLSVAYGRASTGFLSGSRNEISVKYSGNSSFKGITKGDLTFRYSGGAEIGKAGEIELSDRYGSMRIDEVEKINADIGYSSLKIGTLHQSLVLDSKYSGGKIETVKEGFKELRIDTSYGSYSVGFESNCSFDFEINARYGGFKNHLEGIDMKREYVKHNSSEYSGSKGKSGKAFVKASASYGSIEFH